MGGALGIGTPTYNPAPVSLEIRGSAEVPSEYRRRSSCTHYSNCCTFNMPSSNSCSRSRSSRHSSYSSFSS